MSIHPALHIASHIDAIAAALCGEGWLALPDFLPPPQCAALLADCRQRRGDFVHAAVGRGNARRQLSAQRGDATLWLRGAEADTAQRDFLQAMDFLRGELNRRLYLGLRDYEAHYAHYAPGAFYRRHRDAFAPAIPTAAAPAPQRRLSSVFYLNTAAGGGELVLFGRDGSSQKEDAPQKENAPKKEGTSQESGEGERELGRIAPVAGTAVFFLSAEFPHAVLPARADRYSIAGWFRA